MLQLYSVLNTDAKFIILDEPFNHLSPIMVDEIKLLILEKSATKGILISDHAYNSVLSISTKMYILKDGGLRKIECHADLGLNGYLLPN